MRAQCPEDLLALAPALLGYWPEEMLVMLTFGADHAFHAGMPLPDSDAQSDLLRDELVERLMGPVRRMHVRQVVLIYHSTDVDGVVVIDNLVRRAMANQGVEVLAAIGTDGASWASLLEPVGVRVPYDISNHRFVVQAIVGGRLGRGNRDDLAHSFDPIEDEVERTMSACDQWASSARCSETRTTLRAEGEWVRGLIAGALVSREPVSVQDLAHLISAMQELPVRDAAWALLDRDDACDHVRLWSDVVRRTPHSLLAAPAALLGWSAWLAGDGATAWIATERCLDAAPDYPMALCLESILDNAVPPADWSGGFDWAAGLR